MARAKRHLLRRGRRSACGLLNPPLTTNSPAEVTCLACSKTIEMAEAELSQQQRR